MAFVEAPPPKTAGTKGAKISKIPAQKNYTPALLNQVNSALTRYNPRHE